ncbi:MAG: transcription-repair coupling factor [Patescibacteria group bacterium]
MPDFIKESTEQLQTKKTVSLAGLPHLAAQTYYVTIHPFISERVIFWLATTNESASVERLISYWHKIFKINIPVWRLEDINPLRAQHLADLKPQVVVASYRQLNEKLPALNSNGQHIMTLSVGDNLTPSSLSQKLIDFNYEFTGQASQSGYFARRGGVVDIYPINFDRPVRLEFSDRQVISLHAFNPINKRAGEAMKSCQIVAVKFRPNTGRTTFSTYLETIQNPLIIYRDQEEASGELPAWRSVEEKMESYQRLVFNDFHKNSINIHFEHAPLYRQNFGKLVSDFHDMAKAEWQIAVASNRPKELQQMLKEKKAGDVPVTWWPFIHELEGFQNSRAKLLLLTDKEIFGEQSLKHESPRHRVDQALIMGMRPGDYIVHLDHGIGRFVSMTKNIVENITREYFVLQYAEGDKLYVPVETADKISKYIGIAHPKLHRLSGGQWYQLTRKVKQEAKILAQELLKIYAKRELIKVKPFTKPTPEETELSASFPYKETADQSKAINDVESDMCRETPMDRLICGDVGFGKTEVAVRAAFKAAMNKKQVALLSPTTILTQQHYDTFSERLKKFPIKMGILSRFESAKEQQQTIAGMKSGDINIVVGTHRLLSSDVSFKNLGLIVIDEEQRFGVKAKEKLKALRTQSHILTLTATPIPRTLNIALSGVRDVSIIETPPEGRLPINTLIEPYTTELVQKSITEELKRGGQVYYLHNKVETIAFAAKEIAQMVPDCRIGIAHGRLPEKDLAKAMADFDTAKTNILVCSTIIENGLDLPNVNTLIVDNATNFGLAQLYQLRGRIGRGSRQAHAYFLYHRKKLKGNAKKRLQALMEAKKLGSGFQLALRDLEIRGAGNILGKEQHGKVSAIGLSLYTRLLAQAIEELKFGKIQEPVRDILIDLPMEAYIPQEFLPEEERLILYQQLAGIMNMDDLHEMREKMIRSQSREEQKHFPKQLINLFEILEIRILAQKTDMSHIDTTWSTDQHGHKIQKLIIKFLFPLKPEPLARLLQKNPNWQFTDDSVKIDLDKLGSSWLDELKKTIRNFQHQTAAIKK